MNRKIIGISGMSCAGCAQRVEKSIKRLDGVESASVNFAAEKAAVMYDPQKVKLSDLHAVIESGGYKVIETEKKAQVDED
ncbi:MAG: cation transporter, partial [Treponema sp.]|nr:cation transporter [Treponema sp.]